MTCSTHANGVCSTHVPPRPGGDRRLVITGCRCSLATSRTRPRARRCACHVEARRRGRGLFRRRLSTAATASRPPPRVGARLVTRATSRSWSTAGGRAGSRRLCARGNGSPQHGALRRWGAPALAKRPPYVDRARIASSAGPTAACSPCGRQRTQPGACARAGRGDAGARLPGVGGHVPGGCYSLVKEQCAALLRSLVMQTTGPRPGNARRWWRRCAPGCRSLPRALPGRRHYFDVRGQARTVLAEVENRNKPGGCGGATVG